MTDMQASILDPIPGYLRAQIAARPPVERAAYWVLIWEARVLVFAGVPERWIVRCLRRLGLGAKRD